MIRYIGVILLGILISCDSEVDSKTEKATPLLKSTKVFVTEDGGHIDEEFGSTQNFEKTNLKIEYLTDTVYAQAVQYVNACGDAKAWVKIENDTIYLTTKETKEELCASAVWYKYEYWIANPKNKKYVVVQKEG
jgi:hypothetical protein